MSTHNICFYGEIRKNIPELITTKYSSLTIPLLICSLLPKHQSIQNLGCYMDLFLCLV